MKKIINHPERVVTEMLEGLVAAYPNQLKLIDGRAVVTRKDVPVANIVELLAVEEAVMNLPMPVMWVKECSMQPLPERYLPRQPLIKFWKRLKPLIVEKVYLWLSKIIPGTS